jgi:Malectin domain
MKIPHFWTIPMVLLAALFLAGCPTQKQDATADKKTPATTTATVAAFAPAPAASGVDTNPIPTLVLSNGAYRIKAGRGTPYTDGQGRVWAADEGFSGGDVSERDAGTKIVGSRDPEMFLTEHYGMDYFACHIPNGNYTVNLYFAETYDGINGPGDRVFSLNVQGHEFRDFDVWVKAGGPYRPYVLPVPIVVTNGVFRIDFTTQNDNPEINAIEIVPTP